MMDSTLTIAEPPPGAPSQPPRNSTELAVLLALSGIGAMMPWLSKYWLFDHAPNNLAATHILQSLSDSPNSAFAPYFTDQLRIAPYALHNWLLLLLSPVTGLINAHRIIVSTIAMALPITVYFALRRLAPDRRGNAWLYAPLGLTNFAGAGMQAFGLCLPTMLAAWAIVCGARPEAGRRRTIDIAIAAVLFLVSTFAHPAGPVVGALAIGLFQWRRLFRPRALVEAACSLLPAFLWLVASELTSQALRGSTPGHLEIAWTDATRALHYFVIAFTVAGQLEAVARSLVFAICAWGIVRAMKHDRARTLPFARVAVFFLALLLIGPFKVGDATVAHRFAILFVTFGMFCVDLPPILNATRIALISLVTAVAVAAVQYPVARHADAAFDEVIALGAHIPRGATVLPLSFERYDFIDTYKWYYQPWSYLIISRDIITPYIPASGAIGQSGSELRSLAYKHPPSREHLPGPTPRHATDDSCKLLALSPSEDCQSLRTLRYRSYVAQALTYDRALVFDPPAEFVSEMESAMLLEERRGNVWLFRPRQNSQRR